MKQITDEQIKLLQIYVENCSYGGLNKETFAVVRMLSSLTDTPKHNEAREVQRDTPLKEGAKSKA